MLPILHNTTTYYSIPEHSWNIVFTLQGKTPSLKKLAKIYLQTSIQDGEHNSVSTLLVNNRIRIPPGRYSNCVKLIFGMVHPSNFKRFYHPKDALVVICNMNIGTDGQSKCLECQNHWI